MGGGETTMAACLFFFVPLRSEPAIRGQVPDIWRTGSFAHSGSYKLCSSCVQAALGTYAQLPAKGLGIGWMGS